MISYIDKENARTALQLAIKQGVIVKPKVCEDCGTNFYKRLDGHHPDYTQPLAVIWLCTLCHKHEHMRLKAEYDKNIAMVLYKATNISKRLIMAKNTNTTEVSPHKPSRITRPHKNLTPNYLP